MEAFSSRCRQCGRFVRRGLALCRKCVRVRQWRQARRLVLGLSLLGLALALAVVGLQGSSPGLAPAPVPAPVEPEPVVKVVPVKIKVAVGAEEVRRAFALAGEIRTWLGEWEERYRLPSGDSRALVERVDELQGLLQAAVYELRLLEGSEEVSDER
jgi:hypothetical protein